MPYFTRRTAATLVMAGLSVGALPRATDAQEIRYALFDLPLLNESAPHSGTREINELGAIAGASSNTNGTFRPVIWGADLMIEQLPTLGGDYGEAKGINDSGIAVGWSFKPGRTDDRATLWRDGKAIDLGTLGGAEGEANAVNDLAAR